MPSLQQVLNRAQAHLNDVRRAKYTYEVLLPYFKAAYDELEDVLAENNIEALNETSANLDVPANTKRIAYTGTTPTLPVDLVTINYIEEKPDGAADTQFFELRPVNNVPNWTPTNALQVWAWEKQELKLVGASVPVDIRIHYVRGFANIAPTGTVDAASLALDLSFTRGLPFLAYKTAALAAALIDKNMTKAQLLHESAEVAITRAVNRNVQDMQDTPMRRRAYSRRRGGGRRLTTIR